MAAIGLVVEVGEEPEEAPEEAFDVWPENAEIVSLFRFLETQWHCVADRFGVLVVGLDYGVASRVMRDFGMKRKRREAMLKGLRAMEVAALPVLNERRGE